jgi:hypothetical protein
MKLTPDIIEGFAGAFLSIRYDEPRPTPDFHRECWSLYCSDYPACAIAAPRNHAKSTSLTHDYGLAIALFRIEPYILVVGSSEEMAIEHLGDIANELRENEPLIQHFGIKGFLVDQKTDIIVECLDGYQFRILARGAEQKIRGRKWHGKRPGLVLCDDLEDDEQVESTDRRRKFRRWFFRACKQALRDKGLIRVHGTILHEDSLLNRLTRNKTWKTLKYRAHHSFDDFSEKLWPEKFSEERLRNIRQEFINEGDSAGYSQEYLNDPFDHADAYLRRDDFLPLIEGDRESYKAMGCGVDLAVSMSDAANKTSFTIGGKDSTNALIVLDNITKRMDSLTIVETFFDINAAWNHNETLIFYPEDGVIWKAISPMIYAEMRKRDVYLILVPILPVKDKAIRGRALQKKTRAKHVRFDKEADWYPPFEAELLRFTGTGDALEDDRFDSAALLARGLEEKQVEEEDSITEDEIELARHAEEVRKHGGRSPVTGY